MTQYAELTRSTGGTDVPVYNNAATDISPGYAVLAETVAGKTCLCVKLPGAAGGRLRTVGVTTTTIPAGGIGMCCIYGPVLAKAGGLLATGAKVMVSDVAAHLGEVIAQTWTADTEGLGWVTQASTADADWFEVFVKPYYVIQGA